MRMRPKLIQWTGTSYVHEVPPLFSYTQSLSPNIISMRCSRSHVKVKTAIFIYIYRFLLTAFLWQPQNSGRASGEQQNWRGQSVVFHYFPLILVALPAHAFFNSSNRNSGYTVRERIKRIIFSLLPPMGFTINYTSVAVIGPNYEEKAKTASHVIFPLIFHLCSRYVHYVRIGNCLRASLMQRYVPEYIHNDWLSSGQAIETLQIGNDTDWSWIYYVKKKYKRTTKLSVKDFLIV